VLYNAPMRLDDWIRGRVPRLSDTEFGRRVGASQQAVGLWRTGRRLPRQVFVDRIADETGGEVTLDDLMEACEDRRAEVRGNGG
jgi:hypothetical protein